MEDRFRVTFLYRWIWRLPSWAEMRSPKVRRGCSPFRADFSVDHIATGADRRIGVVADRVVKQDVQPLQPPTAPALESSNPLPPDGE